MRQKIKLVVLDLDGTLLNHRGMVSKHGMEVLRKLQMQGIKIMVCSGRPSYSIERIFKDFTCDYIGSCNGQILYHPASGKEIRKPNLNQAQIRNLITHLNHLPMILHYSQGTSFIHATSPQFLLLGNAYQFAFYWFHQLLRRPAWPNKLVSSKEIHITESEKFCFASFSFILRYLSRQLDTSLYSVTFVGNHWLEVQSAGISKGDALRQVMEWENLQPEEVAAIGDGENDLSMLKFAGTFVAMGNAMRKVKKNADEITLTCEKDGAVVWLEDNLLN